VQRLIAVLIGLPLAIIAVALAVANRKAVLFSFDPFSPDAPAYSITVPLFAIVFAAVILGVIMGSTVTWLRHARFRREAKAARKAEAKARRAEVETRPATAAAPFALPRPRN